MDTRTRFTSAHGAPKRSAGRFRPHLLILFGITALVAVTSAGAVGAGAVAAPPAPTVDSITPSSGPIGTVIQVEGTCTHTQSSPVVSFTDPSGQVLKYAPGWEMHYVGSDQVSGQLTVPAKMGISGADPELTEPVVAGDVYGVAINCTGDGNWSAPVLFTVIASPATTTGPTPTVPPAALDIDVSSVAAGGQVTLSGAGFMPGSAVTVDLHSSPVRLTTTAADDTGMLHTTVTIPTNTAPGVHQLVVTGAGPDGVRTLVASISVTAALAQSATPVAAAPTYTG